MAISSKWLVGLGVLAACALALSWRTPGRAADEPKEPEQKPAASQKESGRDDLPLREFMRRKLTSSNKILEGLCTNDSKLVREGAEELNQMSSVERWRVSNDPMYRQFSGEFRRITQQLKEAAEKEHMDQAALKWMSATMSCIDCHSFVRGIMIADAGRN
jgi:hypothetical protein